MLNRVKLRSSLSRLKHDMQEKYLMLKISDINVSSIWQLAQKAYLHTNFLDLKLKHFSEIVKITSKNN